MSLDEHNVQLLRALIRERKKELAEKVDWLKGRIADFEKFPDPQNAANIVSMATDVARYAQGLQDLMDVNEDPRGSFLLKDTDGRR